MGREEGGETVLQIYCMVYESTFSKKRKKRRKTFPVV